MEIFCPNNHLILNDQVCKKCGWQRPIGGAVGQPLWGPVDLLAGLGRESKDSFGTLCLLDGILIAALRSNELVGICLANGLIQWRVAIPVGRRIVSVVVASEKAYVVFQDTHALTEEVNPGSIDVLDVSDGHLEPYYVAPSHALTLPLFFQDRLIVRTAESKLYALDRNDPTKVIWKYPLKTWWATPMNLVDGRIVLVDGNTILSNGTLLAIDAQNGSLCWKKELEGWPTKQLAGSETQLALINNKVELQLLDVHSGKTIGQREFASIYSSPVLHEDQVILSVRAGANKQSPNYYSLVSLSRQTGEPKWQVPLPCRVRIPPACQGDTILLADDAHNLTALSNVDGATRWTFGLGDGDDFIHTHVLLTETLAIFGTYFGQLLAVNTKEEQTAAVNPSVYIEQGNWKSAAQAFALASNFVEAGNIYSEKLGEVDKALQLYERGNAFGKAARLASDYKLYSLALEYYRNAHDVLGEAETLLHMEDLEGASKLFRRLGDGPKAAGLLEQAGKLKAAADLYREIGNIKDFIRLLIKSEYDPPEAEKLRQSGNIEAAAMWEFNNHKYLEAAKDFQSLGRTRDEFDALKQHLAQSSASVAQWVWQRMAELGEQLGDLVTAADAWLELDRPENAGYAFQTLAEQKKGQSNLSLDRIPAQKKEELATLYSRAAKAFEEAGLDESMEKCRHEVRRYRQQPKVVILDVESTSGFREMEWNILKIAVQNVGFGRAIDVTFELGQSRFEVQQESRTFRFNLSSGMSTNHLLHLRPLKEQVGEFVPLEIKWTWKDFRNAHWEEKGSIPVRVVAQKDTQSSQPIIWHVDHVENFVQGTQIKGDQVEQKGDRVTINRQGGPGGCSEITVEDNEGIAVSTKKKRAAATTRVSSTKTCPNCGKTNSSLAKYCIACRVRFVDLDSNE